MQRALHITAHLAGSRHDAASPDPKPVCLVVGAGAGVGQAVAQRFASSGYHVCMVRRGGGKGSLSDDKTRMSFEQFAQTIRDGGGIASTFYADGTDPEQIRSVVNEIEASKGPIEIAVYNIGAQVGFLSLDKTSYRIYELAWRMGSLGAFAIAKEVSPAMLHRGRGTIIYTSATAAFRGNAGQHAHTAAMAARRTLCMSLNHELAPQGIHVCHINLDGPVDAPETLGKMMPELFQKMKESRGTDGVMDPRAIADTYWHLHTQPKCAWTFELDMRPSIDGPWFNSGGVANAGNHKVKSK